MKRSLSQLCFLFILPLCMQLEGANTSKTGYTAPSPDSQSLSQITPTAGPRVKEGLDIALFADFIFWNTTVNGLTYAKTGVYNPPQTGRHQGSVQEVDWTWKPGFKTGLCWNLAHGSWDVVLQYTYLNNEATGSQQAKNMVSSFSYFNPQSKSSQSSQISIEEARAQFSLIYQLVDVEMGRNYYLSRTLKMRPFIGIKSTWQNQDYRVTLFPSMTSSDAIRSHFNHKLWGLGMRGGVYTSWQLAKGVSIYGNLACSSMWLNYETERVDAAHKSNTPPNYLFDTRSTPHLIKPVIDYGLGLRLETYYSQGRYHVLFQAGWESQLWINHTLYANTDNHYSVFDLALHGLTAKVRFDF